MDNYNLFLKEIQAIMVNLPKKILLDSKRKAMISFYEILTYRAPELDNSFTKFREMANNQPNKLRGIIKDEIPIFVALKAFKQLCIEIPIIELNNYYGIDEKTASHNLKKIDLIINKLSSILNKEEIQLYTSILDIEKNGINYYIKQNKEIPTDNLKIIESILAENQDYKIELFNLATKNMENYKAQLLSYYDFWAKSNSHTRAISTTQFVEACITYGEKHPNKIKEFKKNYSDVLQDFHDDNKATLKIFTSKNIELIYQLFALFYKYPQYLYSYYHAYLKNRTIPIMAIKKITNKSLYNGYQKWCKNKQVKELIELNFTVKKQSERKTTTKNISLVGELHFERKCVYNVTEESPYTQDKLTIPFYKRLYKALIEYSIISPNTEEANFLFILGYRISASKLDFKKVEIFKPADTAKQYTGKSLIIQLLLLIGYNIDEIRGNGQYFKDKPTKKKDLILKNCFSPEFTPQDFQFKNNQISFNETICKIVRKAYIVKNEEILDKKYIERLDNFIKNKVHVDVSSINQRPKI